MKVCQLCAVDFTLHHFLLPLIRGIEAAGHEVVAVCAEGPLLDGVRAAGPRVETVPFSRNLDLINHLRTYLRLVALFRRERFDLVHVHTPVAGIIGRLAARHAGVPRIIYTAHGFYFHARMPWFKRAPFIALEWLAGRVTDMLFTQAAEDAHTARRLGLCRGGVIEAIGNGADPAVFHPATDAGGGDGVTILMVGRLVAEKGYVELFEAMRGVDAHLWVVGERLPSDHAGAIDEAMEAARRDPALAPRVRFLGRRDDMAEIMRSVDIFVLPSHREGMPRTIIEAMLSGLPVVATDIRGCNEEVAAGETGLLVPVGDAAALAAALTRRVGDAALRARLGAAGRDRAVALYDESKVVARQIKLLGLGP